MAIEKDKTVSLTEFLDSIDNEESKQKILAFLKIKNGLNYMRKTTPCKTCPFRKKSTLR